MKILFLLKCVLEILTISGINYLLFKLFHKLKKFNIALYFLAMSYPLILNEERANKVALYCDIYCPNKSNCKKCIYWTCNGKEKND